MTLRRLRRALRRTLGVLVAPVLVVPLAAAPAMAAPAHTAAPSRTSQLTAGSPLTQAQAQAQAESTGQPVTVSALTTPNSTTTANPDGSFTFDEAAQPVRAWRNGGWVNLDPALHANTDGTISPAVTTSPLVLSGGGSGPLAVMRAAGRRLSLTWPQTLPAPTLSGATATYPGVLPGVDLVVTADDQGGFSQTLVVKTAAAAQNPALASLKLTASAPQLSISADAAGDLSAATTPSAPPVFTSPAPLMWDSTAPPASQATVSGPSGTSLATPSGTPAASSATAPGAAAQVTAVPVKVSPGAITLTPPASALTGPNVTYPVYIDPTWYPVNVNDYTWTQVDKGYPTTTYWHESSDLQAGKCDFAGCNNVQVARSFIRLTIPSQLTSTTVVNNADLYMEDKWSADGCTGTAAQLWTTGSISSSTDWNNQPSWNTEIQQKSFAFGSSGCGYYKDDVTWHNSELISIMQRDATDNYGNQTFGIRAADETNDLQWKQFHNGSNGYIHLSVTYNDPPNQPTGRTSNPGGTCKTSASTGPTVGKGDVTLYATASDNDTDNSLATKFYLVNSSGSTVFTSTDTVGDNATAQALVTSTDFQNFTGGSQEQTYHWYAISTDPAGLSSTKPSTDCYFTYNPTAPQNQPLVTLSANSAQLGQQITASFDPPSGACPGSTCPVQYTYQFGASPPVTVTADSSGSWDNHTITMPAWGAVTFTVTALAAGGNPSPPFYTQLTGNPPATPYADGYFSGDAQPDLLTLGPGSKPSLWLSPGTGAGTIGTPLDIGGAGTAISPGSDGPADWAGTQVLHGDFTGHGVQDVMAYYPPSAGASAGTGKIIPGNGTASPLAATATTVSTADQNFMASQANGDVPGQLPGQLTAAGNASEIGTGADDLIGISGDSTNPDNYELDLYTNGTMAGTAFAGNYGWTAVLSTTAPAGSWHDYTLATVHVPDTTYPHGDPDNIALFALDTATGALWESTNPNWDSGDPNTEGCPNDGYQYNVAGCTVIGTPGSTWTPITVPWGASPPSQLTGDINSAGNIELWALTPATSTTHATATPYTLPVTGTTLTKDTTTTIAQPHNNWPAAEGNGTTTADTIDGQDATLSSGATWPTDTDTNYITLDGTTGYLTPPANTIPSTDTTPKISLWFRTTTAGGVLASLSGSTLTSSTSSTYDPILYIGTDGHLYGEWWNGSSHTPAISTTEVDDGLWHHATLTATATSQTLYLDNQPGITISGSTNISSQGTNLYYGAGFIGGGWPAEPNNGKPSAPDYFNGDITAITYSYPGGP